MEGTHACALGAGANSGRSRRVCDAGSVPGAWGYPPPRPGSGQLRPRTRPGELPGRDAGCGRTGGLSAPAGPAAAFWKSGCSSGRLRAGVCSSAGGRRRMKGGTETSPGQGQVTAG